MCCSDAKPKFLSGSTTLSIRNMSFLRKDPHPRLVQQNLACREPLGESYPAAVKSLAFRGYGILPRSCYGLEIVGSLGTENTTLKGVRLASAIPVRVYKWSFIRVCVRVET